MYGVFADFLDPDKIEHTLGFVEKKIIYLYTNFVRKMSKNTLTPFYGERGKN